MKSPEMGTMESAQEHQPALMLESEQQHDLGAWSEGLSHAQIETSGETFSEAEKNRIQYEALLLGVSEMFGPASERADQAGKRNLVGVDAIEAKRLDGGDIQVEVFFTSANEDEQWRNSAGERGGHWVSRVKRFNPNESEQPSK